MMRNLRVKNVQERLELTGDSESEVFELLSDFLRLNPEFQVSYLYIIARKQPVVLDVLVSKEGL
jgi:hypothetical protein